MGNTEAWVNNYVSKCGVILGIGDSSAGSEKDRDGETHSPPFGCVTSHSQFVYNVITNNFLVNFD
jgi:hypothetical protein